MSMRMQGRLILVVAACALVYACGGPAYAQEKTAALVAPVARQATVTQPQTTAAVAASASPSAAARARRAANASEPTVMQRLASARCELDDEQETSIATARRNADCAPPLAFNRL
jgi:hypothetical protein